MTADRRLTAAFLALLALTIFVYWPGLHGGYLFDDFVNLDAIGATGPVDNWAAFLRYVTSGNADPAGRPLAMASFLLDSREWPSDPTPFLRTNLFLHLVNGSLLYLLLRKLGRRLDPLDRWNGATALLGSACWLLHPLLVSTTMYIVQREAMLPGTFILAGLLCYVHGRSLQLQSPRAGAAWMIAGIAAGTFLAVLSKANGMLLPLLAWVLEATVLHRVPGAGASAEKYKVLRRYLVVLPSLLVFAYLASFLSRMQAPIAGRDWTIAQRLLTEPRILVEYLHLLMVPRSVSTGLYNDAYPLSSGLLTPVTTLPAIALVLALPVAAWCMRARFPAIAAALLFFFAGQLLESTVIPLEPYFEHRNYVPAMLLFWPLARGVFAVRIATRLRMALAFGIIGLLAATTFQRATLWGNPDALAALWARQNPDSSRAQVTIAMIDVAAGRPEFATQRLARAWDARPEDLQVAFNYVNASCALGRLSAVDSQRLEAAIARSRTALPLVDAWLAKSIDVAASRECSGLGLEEVEQWIAAAGRNPGVVGGGGEALTIEPLLAQLALKRQDPADALRRFDLALAARPTPDSAALQASMLARSGYYREALAHLDEYERLKPGIPRPSPGMPWLHAQILDWQGYWPHEMAVLRGKLAGEIHVSRGASPAPMRAP